LPLAWNPLIYEHFIYQGEGHKSRANLRHQTSKHEHTKKAFASPFSFIYCLNSQLGGRNYFVINSNFSQRVTFEHVPRLWEVVSGIRSSCFCVARFGLKRATKPEHRDSTHRNMLQRATKIVNCVKKLVISSLTSTSEEKLK
jgi:hypothetical protein